MWSELPQCASEGFDGLYGLELLECSDELACGRVAVREALKQPAGHVHGGVHAAIAESLALSGTAAGVAPDGNEVIVFSTQTSFLCPITAGAIHARATRKHRGRTTWVWEIEIVDDSGQLCVLSRATIFVRGSGQ
jgi:uncharacterized protein (TIGR00369 family)